MKTLLTALFITLLFACKKDAPVDPIVPPIDSTHVDGSVGFYMAETNPDSNFWFTGGITLYITGIDTTQLVWIYNGNRCRSAYGWTFTGVDSTYHYHAFLNNHHSITWDGDFTLSQDACFAIQLRRDNIN
jgi:hypothetical protein